MRFQSSISKRLAALVVALTVLAGPASALAADDKEKEKLKPLKDKENPLMIGKRDINKGSLNFYSIEKELKVGRELAAEVDSKAKFITDPTIAEYVNRVGQNIVLRSDAKIPFTIKIIDSPDVNAFALPGGFLYVNSGLIMAADSEAELAGVMAHEIAHITARHGVEQASKGTLFKYLSIPLLFLGGVPGLILQNAVNIFVPLTFLKFSRGAEEEADRLGLQYLWAAGYDPTQMLSFFEKLKAKEKKDPGTLEKLFSTHPATGKRVEKARKLLLRFPDRDEYVVSTSEFDSIKDRLIALTRAQNIGGGDDSMPTLKRKPTLKRGDSGTARDEKEEGPPSLKRKPGSDN
ncbi:MAG TPA: M48 family metallopeptidase [Blastocatellia bacterium]|nr:M48 family metallopeptidase [Blastocatellia bacterium]